MSSDLPPPPDAPAAPATPVVEFVAANRPAVAWALAGVGVLCLAVGIYFLVQIFGGNAPADPAAGGDPADALTQKDKPAGRITRTEHVLGALGGVMGAVAGLGTGIYLLSGVPRPTEAGRRADARVAILLAGGLFGLVLMAMGLFFFISYFGLLVEWLDRKAPPAGAWKVVAALLGFLAGAGLVVLAAQPARADERNNPFLRRLVYGANLGLTSLLLLLVLVIGNVVAGLRVPNKLDTTEGGFYTLDPQTRQYLADLADPVRAYTTFPEDEDRVSLDARRLLAAAQDVNPAKFQVRYLSPTLNREEIRQLRNKYPQADFSDYGILLATGPEEKNYSFVRAADLTDRDFTGGGSRVVFQGESKLVRELLFLTENKTRPTIYFTTGHGELEVAQGLAAPGRGPRRSAAQIRAVLEKGYVDARPLAFDLADPKVPADAAIVVVADPRAPFAPPEAAALRRYMTDAPAGGKKGKLVVLTSPYPRPDGGGVAETGLEGLLAEFGVQLGREYVLNAPDQQYGSFPDAVALAADAALAARNAIALEYVPPRGVLLTNCRTVTPAPQPAGGLAAEVLFETVEGRVTWLEPDPPANPQRTLVDMFRGDVNTRRELIRAKKASRGPRPVAAVVSEPGAASPGSREPAAVSRLAVYGSGDAFADPDRQQRGAGGNADLFAATVNWLRDRPAVANIASKTYGQYNPPKNPEYTRLFWLPVGTALLGVLALGFGVWVFRRK